MHKRDAEKRDQYTSISNFSSMSFLEWNVLFYFQFTSMIIVHRNKSEPVSSSTRSYKQAQILSLIALPSLIIEINPTKLVTLA